MSHKQSDTPVHALHGSNSNAFYHWFPVAVSDNRYRNKTRSILYMAAKAGMGWGLVHAKKDEEQAVHTSYNGWLICQSTWLPEEHRITSQL